MRLGLLKNAPNINYFKYTKIFFSISAILFVLSIVTIFVKPFNLSIDFKGGIVIDIQKDNSSSAQINALLQQNNINGSIKVFNNNQYQIAINLQDIKNNQQAIISGLNKTLKNNNYTILQQQFVGPSVSVALIKGAIIAIIASLFGIFMYLNARFSWQYGLLGVIALMHDFIISLFFVNIFNFSLDTASIAGVLTIIGYSINDTVVLFDQVRENVKKHVKESIESIINRSINQALSRSISTSLTVLLVVTPIFIFGQESLKTFSFLLLIGVTIGTYSSIAIATPLLKYFGNIKLKEIKKQQQV